MTGKITDPRVFISYSWTSAKHEEWVVNLAERLCIDGVDVVLDKWDLKEGQDKFHFMEQMVKDSAINRVLMICDKLYSEKADGRTGGVGTESQIISKKIYEDVVQEKFIPIVVEYSDSKEPTLPTFISSRIYLDFSDESKFEISYEKLIRNIYGRPSYKKPSKGVPPSYLSEDVENNSYRCISVQKQLRHALMNNSNSFFGLFEEFFDSVLSHLELQRTKHLDKPFEERVLASISDLIPLRDSIVDVVMDICRYREVFPTDKIKSFFEKVLKFNYPPEHVTSWREIDFDDYRFFSYELILYVLAILIKNERYSEAANLIHSHYFFQDAHQIQDRNIAVFNNYLHSLEEIYKRKINSNLITIFGDKIKERAKHEVILFKDLMFVESLLYFVLSLKGRLYEWYPRTLVYLGYSNHFDFYYRLKSRSHFDKTKVLFGVTTLDQYKTLVSEAIQRHSSERSFGGWGERNFPSISSLARLDSVCSVL